MKLKLLLAALAALATLSVVAPAHAERSPYIAVGDSITFGAGTTDPLTKAYPVRAGVRSIDQGGSGWSDEIGTMSFRKTLLPRLLALANHDRTLIFHYGINDLILGVPADQLIHRVISIRSELRRAGFRVVLGTIIPSARDHTWSTTVTSEGRTVQQERLIFNHWVRTQSTHVEYARALECDLYQCPGMSRFGDAHVNDRGALVMARVLDRWIASDSR